MAEDEIVQATTRLLDAVARADYEAYAALSDSALTCVEPETMGHVVQGIAFHKHFFDLARGQQRTSAPSMATQNIVCAPHVRMLGPNAALVVYVRVVQNAGKVTTSEETRVWQRAAETGEWKNVHFHRSSKL